MKHILHCGIYVFLQKCVEMVTAFQQRRNRFIIGKIFKVIHTALSNVGNWERRVRRDKIKARLRLYVCASGGQILLKHIIKSPQLENLPLHRANCTYRGTETPAASCWSCSPGRRSTCSMKNPVFWHRELGKTTLLFSPFPHNPRYHDWCNS